MIKSLESTTHNLSSNVTMSAHNPVSGFADLQLQQVYQNEFLDFNLATGDIGDTRPAKRPRISDQNANNIRTGYGRCLIGRLSNLLGAQEPQSLASLPESAR